MPAAIRATYPWTLMWVGQAALHGDVPCFSMAKAAGIAWGK